MASGTMTEVSVAGLHIELSKVRVFQLRVVFKLCGNVIDALPRNMVREFIAELIICLPELF